MDFLGIGVPEVIVIIILALIFIGPRDLPKVAARFAKFLRDLRMMSEGFRTEWQREMSAAGKIEGLKELKDELVTTKQALQEASQEVRSIGRDIQTSMTIDLNNLEGDDEEAKATSSKTAKDTKDTINRAPSATKSDTAEDEGDEYVIGSTDSNLASEASDSKDDTDDTVENEVEAETPETETGSTVQPEQANLDDLDLQTIRPPKADSTVVDTAEAASLTSKSTSNGGDQVIASSSAETLSPPIVSSPTSAGIDTAGVDSGIDIEVGDINDINIDENPRLDEEVKTTAIQSAQSDKTEETANSE